MTTTLAITAAEWASVQDGTLWLVRGGYDACPFVAAAAPCETCDDERAIFCPDCGERGARECVGDGRPHVVCPDCRIELVAACDTCDGQSGYMYGGSWGGCEPCNASGIIHLGWGYAIGQPLPIVSGKDRNGEQRLIVGNGVWRTARHSGPAIDITNALAHYGDPANIIGKWALRVQVTP